MTKRNILLMSTLTIASGTISAKIHPFEDGIEEMLDKLRQLGIKLGVMTNRSRGFLEYEINVIHVDENNSNLTDSGFYFWCRQIYNCIIRAADKYLC